MADTLEKLNAHQRDQHIRFEEEGHKYFIDEDDNYISGTTFIHKLFPVFDAQKVAEKIKIKNLKEEYKDMTAEDIVEFWKQNGIEASAAGTTTHLNIELYSNGVTVDDNSAEFNMFLQFRKDFPYLKPYRTEWTIYDRKLRLAGSIDMVYLDTRDNTFHIYDWKRAKEFKTPGLYTDMGYPPVDNLPNVNRYHYFLQLNLYKYILEKNYGITIKSLFLCRFHPNSNTYELLQCEDLSKEIKKAVGIRRTQVKDQIFHFPIEKVEKTYLEFQNDDEGYMFRD